jgi:outer membrane usher protein
LIRLLSSGGFSRRRSRISRLLELWVNGATDHVVARVVGSKDGLMVERSAIDAAGIRIAKNTAEVNGFVPVSALGTRADVNGPTQQLMVVTDPASAPNQVFDLRRGPGRFGGASARGVLGAYDLAASVGGGGTSHDAAFAALLKGAVFAPRGLFTTTGVAHAGLVAPGFIRLDTAYAFDDPKTLTEWVLGDSLSSQLNWSRSVRFAGLRFARDFSLQPSLSTLPPLAVHGSASAPSTVDLFVNAAQVFTTKVQPGPFQINGVPVVTGQGQVVMTVRDMLGREMSVSLPLYVSGALLAPGLTDYGFELGLVRRDYGLASLDYGSLMGMATLRRGITDVLTLEAHAEASGRVRTAGLGATFVIGPHGEATAAAAFSDSAQGAGGLVNLSFQSVFGPASLYGDLTATNGRFQDVAGLDGPPPAPLRLQLGGGLNLGPDGALTASWVLQHARSGDVALFSAAYAVQLARGWRLGATTLYDQTHSSWAGEIYLRRPLGERTSATLLADSSSGRFEPTAIVQRSVSPDGGFGYTLNATGQNGGAVAAQGTWIGTKAAGAATVALDRAHAAAQVTLSGAMVGIDGGVYATRNSDGAFTLVKTGEPNVEVYREHRLVATTDRRGVALLSGLAPNVDNNIGVDPAAFPITEDVAETEQIANPRRLSAVVLDFTPSRTAPVLIMLQRLGGEVPPAGAQLTLSSGEALVVGRRGEVFVRNLTKPVTGKVEWEGGGCSFSAAPPAGAAGGRIPRLGPVVCQEPVGRGG